MRLEISAPRVPTSCAPSNSADVEGELMGCPRFSKRFHFVASSPARIMRSAPVTAAAKITMSAMFPMNQFP